MLELLFAVLSLAATCDTTVQGPSETVAVRAGQEFAVAVEATPGTGYSWSIAVEPNPRIAVPLGDEYLEPAVVRPGAAGRQCFTFMGISGGSTTFELAYARPFEAGSPPAQTVLVIVNVTPGGSVPMQLPPVS